MHRLRWTHAPPGNPCSRTNGSKSAMPLRRTAITHTSVYRRKIKPSLKVSKSIHFFCIKNFRELEQLLHAQIATFPHFTSIRDSRKTGHRKTGHQKPGNGKLGTKNWALLHLGTATFGHCAICGHWEIWALLHPGTGKLGTDTFGHCYI